MAQFFGTQWYCVWEAPNDRCEGSCGGTSFYLKPSVPRHTSSPELTVSPNVQPLENKGGLDAIPKGYSFHHIPPKLFHLVWHVVLGLLDTNQKIKTHMPRSSHQRVPDGKHVHSLKAARSQNHVWLLQSVGIIQNWFVVSTPLKIWKSDWIIIPAIGENHIHVPNHQPE